MNFSLINSLNHENQLLFAHNDSRVYANIENSWAKIKELSFW